MKIDRYVHDERLGWGAAGILLVITALHAGAIARLFLAPPAMPPAEMAAPVFQVSLEKLPPLRLPQEWRPPEDSEAPRPNDAVKSPPRQTRPVPILVDTPTANPVPPDTQVKPYEIGDELMPGVPGPPVTGGTPDGEGFDDSPEPRRHAYADLKLLQVTAPRYPSRCLRLGIEGRVEVQVLVGENGRVQEVTLGESSGDASLDEAAMEAVRKWRFEPAMKNGMPVRAWVIAPVTFKLID
jgi:protein TonB